MRMPSSNFDCFPDSRLELERVAASDRVELEVARHLLNSELGKPLYSSDRLAATAADPTALLLVVRNGDEVRAAAIARLLVAADAGYYAAFGPAVQKLFSEHSVVSLEALAVAAPWRRRGLASRLIEARVTWGEEAGGTAAVAVSWVSGVAASSAAIYRRLGFTESPPVARFYHQESLRDGWACPRCQGPCECAGILFCRLLSPGRRTANGPVITNAG